MVTPSAHIVVAINPQAAFGKSGSAGDQVCTFLRDTGYRVSAVQGESMDQLVALTRSELGPGSTLVVVGGDGMVSMAVNLLARSKTAFALVPVGTGNDFARGMGYPVGNLSASLETLKQSLSRKPTAIDLGRATEPGAGRGTNQAGGRKSVQVRWFAGILSAGFDALVNERANKMRWPRGASRYTWAMLRELLSLKPARYEIEVDGKKSVHPAVLISVANNAYMGGGMFVAPQAQVTDGKLDLFMLDAIGRLRFLRLFPKVFSGKHVDEPEVHFQQAKRITIAAENVVAYADGERLWPLPVTAEVVSQAVLVHLPN